jgi:hypothetical protein
MEYISRKKTTPIQAGVMPAGAGGVVGFEDYGGISGGDSYHKAWHVAQLARFDPDTLAKSVRQSWDEPFYQEISPVKPDAVSMIGSDVFGPPSFHSTVRNTLLDLRGEAATGAITGEAPEGAGVVSWASFADMNGPAGTNMSCGTCSHQFSAPRVSDSHASLNPTLWGKIKKVFGH